MLKPNSGQENTHKKSRNKPGYSQQQSAKPFKTNLIFPLVHSKQTNLRPLLKTPQSRLGKRNENKKKEKALPEVLPVPPEGSVVRLSLSQLPKALSGGDGTIIKCTRNGLLVLLHGPAGGFCQISKSSDSSMPLNSSCRSTRWTETGNSVYFGKVSVTCLVYISRLNPRESAELLVAKDNNQSTV